MTVPQSAFLGTFWKGLENPKNGKRKGGIKVHIVVNADEIVPEMVWFSEAKKHDHQFLEKLKCDENSIYVFVAINFTEKPSYRLQT